MTRYQPLLEAQKGDNDKPIDTNPDAASPVFQTPRITPMIEAQLKEVKFKYAYVLDLKEKTASATRLEMKDWANALKSAVNIDLPEVGLAHALLEKFAHLKLRKLSDSKPSWDNNLGINS